MKKRLPSTIKLRETLFSYALQLTDYSPHLAQELLQATMQHIIQQASTYTQATSFTSWAKTIMENTYYTTIKAGDIQQLRHQCHRSPSYISTPDDDTYNIKEAIYTTTSHCCHPAPARLRPRADSPQNEHHRPQRQDPLPPSPPCPQPRMGQLIAYTNISPP